MVDKVSKEILDFLRGSEDPIVYLHRTEEEQAESILENGFRFFEWYTTTDASQYDDAEIEFWDIRRTRDYGECTVVLGVSKALWELYNVLIEKHKPKLLAQRRRNFLFELISPEMVKDYPNNLYVLPVQFVKGYCNSSENLIVHNPKFDPGYLDDGEFLEEAIKAYAERHPRTKDKGLPIPKLPENRVIEEIPCFDPDNEDHDVFL